MDLFIHYTTNDTYFASLDYMEQFPANTDHYNLAYFSYDIEHFYSGQIC